MAIPQRVLEEQPVVVPAPKLAIVPPSEAFEEEPTGGPRDREIFRALRSGIVVGGPAGCLVGMLLVAVATLVQGSFGLGILAAAAAASFLGGAYMGGVVSVLHSPAANRGFHVV